MALVGNPNSGKTTLFNALTGSDGQVGNRPGVTVEGKTGRCLFLPEMEVTDTPGCYSLSPFTPEEQVTLRYLEQKPDVLLNVVDSTHLERNLLLTTQLLERGLPVVVALNMQDEAEAQGIEIDAKELSARFGCPFVPISAARGRGLTTLAEQCSQIRGRAVDRRRYADAAARYADIETALAAAVRRKVQADALSDRIDSVLLHKWLAFPILAVILTAVFFISVGGLGGWIADGIERLTPLLQSLVGDALSGAPQWLPSLLGEGVIGGVMSVVGFLPQVMMLYGCIALLEDCGYMARIAFVTDRMLHGLGLSGRSFVCMTLGCGCSVPAIMSTRTIKNSAERETTVTLASFVPCSAKLALIAFFTSYIFDGNALFAVSFYFASVIAIALGGLLLRPFKRGCKGCDDVFMLELPPYRLPRPMGVLRQMWQRGRAFLAKTGTVILASSIVLWTMTHLDFRLSLTDAEHSMLAAVGRVLSPLFRPLGFDDRGCGWQLSVAALSGIAAKETVITTLQILLPEGIRGAVSPLGAYCFVLYNLLTVPCVAAVAASVSEQGVGKAILSMLFQALFAYTAAFALYTIGSLAAVSPLSVAIVLASCIAIALLFALLTRRRRRIQKAPKGS